jgi:NADH:ubiquinone oxidoreductase subunit 5 (subunit L)/multisubunit Na+/H+ antiporter MnhA subunit
VITAFYMFRMWLLVFAGEPRGFATPAEQAYDEAHGEEHALDHGHAHDHADGHDRNPAAHAHESDWIMVGPLVALAVFSVIAGWGVLYYVIPNPFTFLGLGTPPLLERMLDYGEPYRALDPIVLHHLHFYALGASLVILFVGVGLGLLYYAPPGFPYFVQTRLRAERSAARFGGIYRFLVHKWYFDELYWAVLVRPCLAFARLCRQIDQVLIDGLVNGSAALTAFLSRLEGIFDMIAVDRLVNLTAQAVYVLGDWSRSIQTGRLRNYLMFLTLGVVGLFVGVFFWIRG